MEAPPPPRHLSAEARAFWGDVHAAYVLDQVQHKQLQVACEAIDDYRLAREAYQEHGPLVQSADGTLRANPAAAQMRDARAQFLMAVKSLNLDVEPAALGRPGRKGRGGLGVVSG